MRGLDEDNQLFVLRGKSNSKVEYYDKERDTNITIKQGDLADKLSLGKKETTEN